MQTIELEKPKIKQAIPVIQPDAIMAPIPIIKSIEKTAAAGEGIDYLGAIPFFLMHLTPLLVFMTGVSPVALIVCFIAMFGRMFGVTGGFHRYFAHRTYKTSRVFQFIMAFLGTSAAQMGPLWWAAHHRHHHRYSDMEEDIHSPITKTFFESHVGWILRKKHYQQGFEKSIPDFERYPELRFLNKYPLIPPTVFAFGIYFLGVTLQKFFPSLHTSGFQMAVWGFFISTVLLYHATFSINSVTHLFGRRRYETKDQSRNSFLIALYTMGEGWHNNHHHYPTAERQGFFWWEIDATHYILKVLSWFGIVWAIREPAPEVYRKGVRPLVHKGSDPFSV